MVVGDFVDEEGSMEVFVWGKDEREAWKGYSFPLISFVALPYRLENSSHQGMNMVAIQ